MFFSFITSAPMASALAAFFLPWFDQVKLLDEGHRWICSSFGSEEMFANRAWALPQGSIIHPKSRRTPAYEISKKTNSLGSITTLSSNSSDSLEIARNPPLGTPCNSVEADFSQYKFCISTVTFYNWGESVFRLL